MHSKISIILVNFNSQKLLSNCLNSLYSNGGENEHSFEVIVIDNNSSDDSCEMVRQNLPNVGLIQNDVNLGFGKANNLAVRQAKGEYILLLNPDTVVDGNILDETFKFFSEHSDHKSAFGGILLNPDGTEQRGSQRSFPNWSSRLYEISKFIFTRKIFQHFFGTIY